MTLNVTDNCKATFDVAIVGGGPGGTATALALRTHAPSLSVVLIEASRYDSIRVGESLPPPVRPILEHLGVWDAFRTQRHREVYSTTGIWGTTVPIDNDYFYMPANVGWHVDRTAFDSMLADQAEASGVTIFAGTRLHSCERAAEEWCLTLSTCESICAKFVVDATGGNANVARSFGAYFVNADKLVAIGKFFKGTQNEAGTLVEAFEDGWWYTAGLPNGRRFVACVTDSDIARRMKFSDLDLWDRKLSEMPGVSATLQQSKPDGALLIRSTESRRLEPAAGDRWLAVGDAASRFDPLSSQGIVKALRSGIFASYVIGDLLLESNDAGIRRYRRYIIEEFNSYVEVRAKYYREEQRWPTSEFWRRRHAGSPLAIEPVYLKQVEKGLSQAK